MISIIVGSTRPGRNGGQVAGWGREVATWHAGDEAAFDVLDLKEFGLPLLDELVPALVAPGSHPHTVRWAQRAGSLVAGAFPLGACVCLATARGWARGRLALPAAALV